MKRKNNTDILLSGVGNILRCVRHRKGVSLRQLERKTGISRSLLSRYENNEVNLTTDVLEQISNAIDVPLPYIVIEYLKNKYPYLSKSRSDISKALNAISEALE